MDLFGSIMFPDSSGDNVPLMYLELVQDLEPDFKYNLLGFSRCFNRNPFRLKVRNDRRTKISTANLSSGLNGVCQETFQGGPPSVFLWHQNPI
jgi:hypothetical protein